MAKRLVGLLLGILVILRLYNNNRIIMDVEYISQNKNKVYNGCEVTCLLMALHYKGLALDKNIYDIANGVFGSDDPSMGFIYDIFSSEPKDKLHWIDTNPLVEYGNDFSLSKRVMNNTGNDIDSVADLVMKGNPVVIYTTSKFMEPVGDGDISSNMHVQLVVGYNRISNNFTILDPYTRNGKYKWKVNKRVIEKLYNRNGKRSIYVK